MTKKGPSLMFLNYVVFRAVAAALGLDPDDQRTAYRVRQALINPSPPPPPQGQDVVYFHLEPEDAHPQTEVSLQAENAEFFRYASYALHLVFYGPEAEESAWEVYHRLYMDGYLSPRQIFRLHHVYPIPSPAGPTLVWEQWKEQHRLRADLTVRLMAATNLSRPAGGRVEQPPEVSLET